MATFEELDQQYREILKQGRELADEERTFLSTKSLDGTNPPAIDWKKFEENSAKRKALAEKKAKIVPAWLAAHPNRQG
jgi:hypothetical protein